MKKIRFNIPAIYEEETVIEDELYVDDMILTYHPPTVDENVATKKYVDDLIGLQIGRTVSSTTNLSLSDTGKLIICDSSNDLNLNIPTNTFEKGHIISVLQLNTGRAHVVSTSPASLDVNEKNSTSGADSIIQIICISDTSGNEIFKVIGGC